MRQLSTTLAAVWILLASCLTSNLQACDWDSETLLQERMRFPTALEIILGKFPRHSPAYYQWRLDDRLEKLQSQPDDDRLLDDVAVSYEKLGRYDEAIEIAIGQLFRNPLRYESLANLGTFLIHSGKLQKGLGYIEEAIEVNPDAHFGREKYQVYLVQYVLSKTGEDGVQLPLATMDAKANVHRRKNFADFLSSKIRDDRKSLTASQKSEAVTGILGMMRFSRHDSPILLEALGDLQLRSGANQLAYRAYKAAASHAPNTEAREAYAQLAAKSIEWQQLSWRFVNDQEITEKDLAADIAREQADADAWFSNIVKKEAEWISEGVAVDEKFNSVFRGLQPVALETNPIHDTPIYDPRTYPPHASINGFVFSIILVIALVGLGAYAAIRFRKQRIASTT